MIQTNKASVSLLDMDRSALAQQLKDLGEPSYRSKQIWDAIYLRYATTFTEITDIPNSLRKNLETRLQISPIENVMIQTSADQSTSKCLMKLHDGEVIETVLMRYDPLGRKQARKTICVSSQAGCAMKCSFCATGTQGYRRQLTSGEMLGQIHAMAKLAFQEGSPITNIVFMGMGEPLANYGELHKTLTRITDATDMAFSPRRVTVSTVGILSGIRKLTLEHPTINLAVSLHAPTDKLRQQLIPVQTASISEIIATVREHIEITKRRVSFEYVLIAGINDLPKHATELATLLRGLRCQVNLIPLNPVDGIKGKRPSRRRTLAFESMLESAGISVTVRAEKGADISAACGQLRGDLLGPRPLLPTDN